MTGKLTSTLSAFSLALGLSLPAHAIVYTASNEASGNRVLAFDVDTAENLIEIGSFDTLGQGTGAAIGNQSALTTDASDRWLFVTNAGDGSLTSFRLQPTGLQWVDKQPSGGHSAISVTVFGTLVYVLNEGDGTSSDPKMRYDNISGFRFTAGGLLEPIPNSTRILDRSQLTAPAQIGFNKSGTVLLITEKATNQLVTYVMRTNGTPAWQPLKHTSAVPTPFGFQFGDRDFVFITEANGGSAGVTASYRLDRTTGAVSPAVDVIEQGNAACWTVLSSDQTIGYTVNTGSDSVSLYRIGFAGTLDPFTDPEKAVRSGGSAPRDAILSQNNHHFFVLNNGSGSLQSFRVGRNGTIYRRGAATVPSSATGLFAR